MVTSAFVHPILKIFPSVIIWNRKTAEKQELALWHLVNRLVPENA
jgi:hypothetical protein